MVASEYSGGCWEVVGERAGRRVFWVLDAEVVRCVFGRERERGSLQDISLELLCYSLRGSQVVAVYSWMPGYCTIFVEV
jgi:hypothetical protein